jgi:hypothetical protein
MNPQLLDFEVRLMHRHEDGSWAELDADPTHHDPAQHDPERDWGRWRIFRCRTCHEVVTVRRGEAEVPADEAAG